MASRDGARDLPGEEHMPRSSAETREHVLGVAHELFYWHGIRATGVDRVAAAAGVRSEERRVGKECRYRGSAYLSSRRRHTRLTCDWSSDVCSSDLSSVSHTSCSTGTGSGPPASTGSRPRLE